jgi:hypothetical protein
MTGNESVSFEPKNKGELRHFLEAEKDRHHELWVVLTKRAFVSPQPVSFA